jgi:hypothetical protein
MRFDDLRLLVLQYVSLGAPLQLLVLCELLSMP